MNENMSDSGCRIEELRIRIADLKARMPAHSVHTSMMIELEELEEELEALLKAGKDPGQEPPAGRIGE